MSFKFSSDDNMQMSFLHLSHEMKKATKITFYFTLGQYLLVLMKMLTMPHRKTLELRQPMQNLMASCQLKNWCISNWLINQQIHDTGRYWLLHCASSATSSFSNWFLMCWVQNNSQHCCGFICRLYFQRLRCARNYLEKEKDEVRVEEDIDIREK